MSMFDNHTNLAIGTIRTAPENAGDTSFVLEPGFADQFAANMPVTICPPRTQPTRDNSEIGYLTAVAGDTLTILRAQESSIAMQVKTGWQVIGSVTAKTITDIEGAVTALDMLADALGVDVDALKLAVSSLQSGKVDKVAGKVLSQNDYTNADKARLENTSGTNTGDQDLSDLATTAQLTAHTSNTNNPHSVTKDQVGLGNVQNLAPADLPISTAQQVALDGKVKVGGGIISIRSTYDLNESPVSGEMLVVLSAKLFTDFSEYAIGSQPSDWVQRWVSSQWTVESDASATSGVVLRHNAASGTGRRSLSWSRADDMVTGINKQEILVKFKSPGISTALRTVMRGGGASANTTGVVGYLQTSGTRRIFEYLNGATGGISVSPSPFTYAPNTWYLIRHRVSGAIHSWKMWPSATPEPTAWDVTINSPTTLTGFCGLSTFNAGVTNIDWVSIDLAGGTAEMGPL